MNNQDLYDKTYNETLAALCQMEKSAAVDYSTLLSESNAPLLTALSGIGGGGTAAITNSLLGGSGKETALSAAGGAATSAGLAHLLSSNPQAVNAIFQKLGIKSDDGTDKAALIAHLLASIGGGAAAGGIGRLVGSRLEGKPSKGKVR